MKVLRGVLASSEPAEMRTDAIRLALRVVAPYCPADRLTRFWAAGDVAGSFPRLTEATEAFHAIVRKLREAGVYEW